MVKLIKQFFPELLLLICLLFLLLFNLGQAPVERWDEYTNIQVVEETLKKGNGLILQYDNSPFFEKPPFWYYLSMLVTNLLGSNIVIYRLISSVAGILFVIAIYLISLKSFSKNVARWTTLALLASGQLFFQIKNVFSTHNFRSADLDSLQLAFIALSMLLLGFFLNKRKNHFLILAGIFSGLAFLTKGPFALLPVIMLTLFLIINKRDKVSIKWVGVFAISLLLVILPWHIWMYLEFKDQFLNEYIGYHMINRSLGALEGHEHDFLYYLKLLLNPSIFVSFGLWLLSLASMLKKRYWFREWKYFMPIAGTVIVVVLLSLIQTKLAWYLLYFYLFSFLILGWYIDRVFTIKSISRVEQILIIVALITTFLTKPLLLITIVAIIALLIFVNYFYVKQKGLIYKGSIVIVLTMQVLSNVIFLLTR